MSACPSWCNIDAHQDGITSHRRSVGRDGDAYVTIVQPLGWARPEVIVGWNGPGELASVLLSPDEVSSMSALLDRLGHPALAGLVNIAYGYLQTQQAVNSG